MEKESSVKYKGIGDFHYPWATATVYRNKHVLPALVRAVDVANACGVTVDKRMKMFATLGEYVFPSCSEDGLLFGSLMISWMFIFDDIFDEEKSETPLEVHEATINRMAHIMDSGKLPEDEENQTLSPIEKLGLDVYKRAVALAGDRTGALERFKGTVRVSLEEGVIPMIMWQRSDELPDLSVYEPLRLINCGADFITCADELISGVNVTDDKANLPEVKRMRDIVCLVIGFSNDIYSYEREIAKHQRPVNAVVMRNQKTQDLPKAIHEQVEQVNGWLAEFVQIKADLEKRGVFVPGDDLATYIKGMENNMLGCKEWSEACGRYKSLTPSSPTTTPRKMSNPDVVLPALKSLLSSSPTTKSPLASPGRERRASNPERKMSNPEVPFTAFKALKPNAAECKLSDLLTFKLAD